MPLTIPDTIFESTRMTEEELLQELALALFAKEKLTLAQASRLAQMNRLDFQYLLASRNIPLHYDVEELKEDIETLKRLGRIDDCCK